MTGNDYQKLAMRTYDGNANQKLSKMVTITGYYDVDCGGLIRAGSKINIL